MEKWEGFSFNDKRSILYILSFIIAIGYIFDVRNQENQSIKHLDQVFLTLTLISLVLEFSKTITTVQAFSVTTYGLLTCVIITYIIRMDSIMDVEIFHSSSIIGALIPVIGFILGKKHTLYVGLALMLYNIHAIETSDNEYIEQNRSLLLLLPIGYTMGMYYLISVIEKGAKKRQQFLAGLEQQNSENHFINTLSLKLVASTASEDITPTMLHNIKKYCNAQFAVFTIYNCENKGLAIHKTEIDNAALKTLLRVIGIDMPENVIPLDDATCKRIMRKQVYQSNSVAKISFGAISPKTEKAIYKLTGLRHYFTIVHQVSNNLYGTTTIGFTKTQQLPSISMLESYAYITSITLKKNYAERALQKSEIKLRQITDQITDVVFVTDMNFNITYLSPSIKKLTGDTVEQHIKRRLVEKYPQASIKKIMMTIQEELENEKKPVIDLNRTRIIDLEIYRNDNSLTSISTHASFVRDEAGNPIGFQGIIRDITRRKRAEEALHKKDEKLKTIIETIPDYLFHFNHKGQFINYYQPKKLNSSFLPIPELINKNITDIFDINLAGKIQDAIHQTIRNNKHELIIELEADQYRCYIARFARINDNEILAVVGNITEIKEKEKQLEQYSEELKRLIADKDRFMRIISHDLRSPFQTLMGFSEVLANNMNDYSRDEITKGLQVINQTSQTTFNLLSDLLLWAKAQSGKLVLEHKHLSLETICLSVIDELTTTAQQKNLRLINQVSRHINIWADPNVLKTVLRNLISNAIKYSFQESDIIIKAETNKNTVEISVSDTGVGISPERQLNMWDDNQLATTIGTANEQGTGNGLLLCKELVEKHGGRIWVESSVESGSTFIIEMPLQNTNAEQLNINAS